MEEKQQVPDMVDSLRRYVEGGKFNKDSSIWVVHLGETPAKYMKKTYGFDWEGREDFFSHFMWLSLTHRVYEVIFDTIGWEGNVNFIRLYLMELEPGEDTNISVEFLELVAKGWGVET